MTRSKGDPLALALCSLERGRREVDVAQVSELLARLGDLLATRPGWTLGHLARWTAAAVRRARAKERKQ